MWFWLGFEPLCCQYDFSTSGAIIKTIPIDEQGLDVEIIKTRFIKGINRQFICAAVSSTTVSLTAGAKNCTKNQSNFTMVGRCPTNTQPN
jgi:hypothetical protein